ncbi:hypothetical protein PWT90_06028 [Aphanocladium album]|nr:hypothetical protein PWT90_06028 [Aphanocladium album]
MQTLRARGNPFAHWTVAHTQQVCVDVHRMPPADRAGFGDLHKQMRELYFFHQQASQLFPPAGQRPFDMVAVEVEGGTMGAEKKITRVLRDFILGMNEHLLARWRPFSRARPEWNIDTVYDFFEDFSCFLMHHDKFRGQDVVLMQAPQAPSWAAQSTLRFKDAVPFRGYQERLETGLREGEESRPSSEESNSDRAEEDCTAEQRDEALNKAMAEEEKAKKQAVEGSGSA